MLVAVPAGCSTRAMFGTMGILSKREPLATKLE